MPFTSIAEFEATESPTPAETELIEACRVGAPCILNGGTRPTAPSDATQIRADLLRLLILGGTTDCALHTSGVRLKGGYITGTLDLRFSKARGQCTLNACHFVDEPYLTQAKLPQLSLDGSQLPGLFAQGMKTNGSVLLRNLTATGTVDVNGAQIGGQLDCDSATLNGAGGKALNAQGATTGADLFLRNLISTGTVAVNGAQIGGQLTCTGATLNGAGGKALNAQGLTTGESLFLRNVTATGTVDVSGAQIGGQMGCEGAKLDGAGGDALSAQRVTTGESLFLRNLTATGTVDVSGGQIGGQLDCEGAKLNSAGGDALFAQSLRVSDAFLWRGISACNGKMNLNSAYVATLVDDPESWAKVGRLNLDGFTYDRITASPTDAKTRLRWLRKGCMIKGQFHPQPYTQLAMVLQTMGHDRAARQVKIEREVLSARQVRADRSVALDGTWGTGFRSLWFDIQNLIGRVWDFVLRHGAGYGYRPGNSVLALVVLWWVASWLASAAWTEGSFAPNSDVLLVSEGWQAALAADCIPPAPGCDKNPADTWANDPKRGMDWDSFNAAAYGADLVVPILDLGQTAAWAPSKDRGTYGAILWWGRWVLEALGWLATGLGAAAITGVIKRKEE